MKCNKTQQTKQIQQYVTEYLTEQNSIVRHKTIQQTTAHHIITQHNTTQHKST